jgi:hypothetical protein
MMALGMLALALTSACATTPQLYVINETGRELDVVFATKTRFRLSDGPQIQTMRGFPEYDWTLRAGTCVYRYPPINTSDPYWMDYANTARVAGTPDLLMRIGEDFRVRGYTYNSKSSAMVMEELRVGGLPLTPAKTCS